MPGHATAHLDGLPTSPIPCYTAHLLLFLYPNDARRDIGLRSAIRDSYVGWTYACFYSYVRMVSVVASVRGAQFVKVALACLMTVLPELITVCELVLKTNVFRFLVSTRDVRLAGSMFKPLSNQSLHGSGPRALFLFAEIVSPAP